MNAAVRIVPWLVVACPSVALAQHAILISADPTGAAGNGNSGIGTGSPNAAPMTGLCASADGRFVAFLSEAQNLVTPATLGGLFIRDVRTGATRVGVVDLAGQPSSGVLPEFSSRGRYLAFASDAPNLVPNDTNGRFDVFVTDFATGVTERVSVSSTGGEGDGHSGFQGSHLGNSVQPYGLALSTDGRFVAFSSSAANLVPNDTNLRPDVFVHDRLTGQTALASPRDPSVPPHLGSNSGALAPRISDDGRWLAFTSSSHDLVPNDTNGVNDVFVRDMSLGTTTRVSVDSTGQEANGNSGLVALSADGRYALFTSYATNLVGVPVSPPQAYLHDLISGQTTLESLDASGTAASGASDAEDLSPDGRFVLFDSAASSLVVGDTNGQSDLFVRDRQLGTVKRVNLGAGGIQADQPCGLGRLIRGGRGTVFVTLATTFSALDTNGLSDVYLCY